MLGILGLILSLFINIDFNPTNKEQNSTSSNGFSIHNFIAKEAVPVAIVMLLVGITYAAILTYLQAFAEQRDLVSAASYFFIFYAVASLVTRPIAGRLMDSKNENVVVYPSFIALILSFICLMFSFNSGLLLLSGVLLGIGYGNLLHQCKLFN